MELTIERPIACIGIDVFLPVRAILIFFDDLQYGIDHLRWDSRAANTLTVHVPKRRKHGVLHTLRVCILTNVIGIYKVVITDERT